MNLFVVRHGIAEDVSADGSDERRDLTATGIAMLEEQASTLRTIGVEWDLILTSPLTRARRTAEVLARGLGGRSRIEVSDTLAPGAAPHRVANLLRERANEERVTLVGHEPDLGRLVAYLLGSPPTIAFERGGLCWLRIEPPFATATALLRWFVPPLLLTGRRHRPA